MCTFEIFERSSMVECDEIEPRLYLGNLDAAESGETLKCCGITHVLTIYMFPITVPEGVEIETLFIDVEDSADCDILSYFERANAFIKEGQEKGACLVHCYGGVSRSATLVVAYLMNKYNIGVDEALKIVKNKRYCACPNAGFLSQLRLYENMKNTLDEDNIDYKIFSLYHLGKQVSSENNFSAIQKYLNKFKGKVYDGDKFKCKQCRKCLFMQGNVIPHIQGQDLYWNNFAQQLISEKTQILCKKSLFIEFLPWISEALISPSGKILCPECSAKIGNFCWKGQLCSCGATISPSFRITESNVDRDFSCVSNLINDLAIHNLTCTEEDQDYIDVHPKIKERTPTLNEWSAAPKRNSLSLPSKNTAVKPKSPEPADHSVFGNSPLRNGGQELEYNSHNISQILFNSAGTRIEVILSTVSIKDQQKNNSSATNELISRIQEHITTTTQKSKQHYLAISYSSPSMVCTAYLALLYYCKENNSWKLDLRPLVNHHQVEAEERVRLVEQLDDLVVNTICARGQCDINIKCVRFEQAVEYAKLGMKYLQTDPNSFFQCKDELDAISNSLPNSYANLHRQESIPKTCGSLENSLDSQHDTVIDREVVFDKKG